MLLQSIRRTDKGAGVLEALGIIRKPPPLWERAWDDLTIVDRPKAFKQLKVSLHVLWYNDGKKTEPAIER